MIYRFFSFLFCNKNTYAKADITEKINDCTKVTIIIKTGAPHQSRTLRNTINIIIPEKKYVPKLKRNNENDIHPKEIAKAISLHIIYRTKVFRKDTLLVIATYNIINITPLISVPIFFYTPLL